MIDLSPNIIQALQLDSEIALKVGLDPDGNTRIYQRNIPYPDMYPQITFFEIANFDSAYADDEAVESMVSFQVSIWTREADAALISAVDRSIKAIGFRRTSTYDDYEPDVEVYHKGMRYMMAVPAD